eukprot:7312316-Lingulodinium_polyedra.AAC.1
MGLEPQGPRLQVAHSPYAQALRDPARCVCVHAQLDRQVELEEPQDLLDEDPRRRAADAGVVLRLPGAEADHILLVA